MNNVTWKDELIRGLTHFGGEAHRKELFEYIRQTTAKNITKEFVRTLQKELERLSKDSNNFGGTDIFYSVEGIGSGVWGLNNYIPDDNMDKTQDDISHPEGKDMLKQHIKKERSAKLIRTAKEAFKKKHGHLFCEMCGIDFEVTYGDLGKDFIEIHHNKELSANTAEASDNQTEDFVMLCSNCHSMVHRTKSYNAAINELQEIVKKKPQY